MDVHRPAYSHSDLQRYARCPRSFQLHELHGPPAEPSESTKLDALLRATCSRALREHVDARRTGGLDPAALVRAYRDAWQASDFTDPARFADHLAIVKAWAARQGCLDWHDVVAVDQPFDIAVGDRRLTGRMDLVLRAEDTLRVRALRTARIPMSGRDVEESLQLALYDLAAGQLWPSVARVQVEVEMLRHGSVLRLMRTEAQRAATREYVLSTVDRIEQAARERGDFPPRPSSRCPTCDQRPHCPAYADLVAGKRVLVGTSPEDLAGVSREREELARLVKVLCARKDALDDVLRARIESEGELRAAGMRYALATQTHTEYPIGPTLEALTAASGRGQDELLERLATIHAPALRKLLDELAPALPQGAVARLRGRLDRIALRTVSLRLVAREDA